MTIIRNYDRTRVNEYTKINSLHNMAVFSGAILSGEAARKILVAPAPISSQFTRPHQAWLVCAPNQN